MGVASRRTARPARNATPSSPRMISGNGGPDQPLAPAPSPNPPPASHRQTNPLATKKSPRASATTNPRRRGNRRPRAGPGSGIGEPVANAVDGEEVAGVTGGWLDLLAQVLDVGVDRPLVGLE